MATGVSASASCDLRVPASLSLLLRPLAMTLPGQTTTWHREVPTKTWAVPPCHHATQESFTVLGSVPATCQTCQLLCALKLRSPSVPALSLDISFNIVDDNDIISFIVLEVGVTFCQSDILAQSFVVINTIGLMVFFFFQIWSWRVSWFGKDVQTWREKVSNEWRLFERILYEFIINTIPVPSSHNLNL